MPKSSKAPAIRLQGISFSDPRVAMRVLIGFLLLVNLAVAVIAFKPFGGSADDLRKEQARLSTQLRQIKANLDTTRDHVGKIQIARSQGDEFLEQYIMERRSAPEITVEEMTKAATEAGMRALPESSGYEPIEGSDTLQMMSITAGFEGSYAGLTKLVNALEKWPRLLIIDTMNLNAPQQQNGQLQQGPQQNLNVTLRLLTFVRDEAGVLP